MDDMKSEGSTVEKVTIHFTVNEDIYKRAKEILDSLGITVEDSINLFFKAVIACNGLPFTSSEQDLDSIRNGGMNDQT